MHNELTSNPDGSIRLDVVSKEMYTSFIKFPNVKPEPESSTEKKQKPVAEEQISKDHSEFSSKDSRIIRLGAKKTPREAPSERSLLRLEKNLLLERKPPPESLLWTQTKAGVAPPFSTNIGPEAQADTLP